MSFAEDVARGIATGDGPTMAYPTDERIRQKAKLKAGHVPKARKQDVEDHHDDCGTDLSGLAPYLLAVVPLAGDDSPADYMTTTSSSQV